MRLNVLKGARMAMSWAGASPATGQKVKLKLLFSPETWGIFTLLIRVCHLLMCGRGAAFSAIAMGWQEHLVEWALQ